MGRFKNAIDTSNQLQDIEQTISTSDLPIKQVPIDQIDRWEKQPRKYFSESSLQVLANSFAEHGFKGVVLVRPSSKDKHLIVYGERRWRAAKLAGLKSIPCFIEEMDDATALKLAMGENLLREDLSKLEETEGLLSVLEIETGLEQEAITRLVNSHTRYWKSGSYVGTSDEAAQFLPIIVDSLKRYGVALSTFKSKHLQVLSLPEDVKRAHLEANLDYTKAIAIGKIPDEYDRSDILGLVADGKLNTFKEVDEAVKDMLDQPRRAPAKEDVPARFKAATSKLRSRKTWEYIQQDTKRSSRIVQLLEELEGLLEDE
ncbi:ParB/RepB/Spo0J family partition protein [Leptolyngbyaceae cyanobacterium CCMR0082]|uniref:ParB/RepB/Spo0J family partition protein n=1 Tax=Adonisia turfae CCMR0082 TaxID=2304604 RepID=A0A6M0SBE6_9CYAN|nr:ParB/RepB/Spo0J family partition protein [Adonisia turfae]NEZ65636.1 ParB/RepB/Spo0J family partition protein [Adonisia turfae CCMR0082]